MIVSGDIDKIETLASEHTASDIVAAIEGDGDVPSPIHRAAQYGHAESIKAMIKASNKTALVNQASIKGVLTTNNATLQKYSQHTNSTSHLQASQKVPTACVRVQQLLWRGVQ